MPQKITIKNHRETQKQPFFENLQNAKNNHFYNLLVQRCFETKATNNLFYKCVFCTVGGMSVCGQGRPPRDDRVLALFWVSHGSLWGHSCGKIEPKPLLPTTVASSFQGLVCVWFVLCRRAMGTIRSEFLMFHCIVLVRLSSCGKAYASCCRAKTVCACVLFVWCFVISS